VCAAIGKNFKKNGKFGDGMNQDMKFPFEKWSGVETGGRSKG